MSTVQHVDYEAKRIYLSATTVGVPLDLVQVYRDVRNLRAVLPHHQTFRPLILAGGNVRKTMSSFTQPYAILLNGAYIVPFGADQRLMVTREVFTDDGRYGVECFDRSTVSASVDIDIDMNISPVEVRTVNISGSTPFTVQDIRVELDSNSIQLANINTKLDNIPIDAPAIAQAVRSELSPEMTKIMTLSSNPALTPQEATMLIEIYRVLGLDPTKPLIVTQSSRTAGVGISQTIASSDTATVVTRNV